MHVHPTENPQFFVVIPQIEAISGVDYIKKLEVQSDETQVKLFLVYSGTHKIELIFEKD